MMFGIPLKFYGTVAVAGALVAGFLFVKNLQSQVSDLERDKAVLEQTAQFQSRALKVQASAISQWEVARRDLLEKIGQLSKVTIEARGETRRLYETFKGHDLNALATAKPGLIERRINRGSAQSNRMLECASGNKSACRAIGQKAGEEAPTP